MSDWHEIHKQRSFDDFIKAVRVKRGVHVGLPAGVTMQRLTNYVFNAGGGTVTMHVGPGTRKCSVKFDRSPWVYVLNIAVGAMVTDLNERMYWWPLDQDALTEQEA